MSGLSLRLPESLHETVRRLAKRDHVSMNQFIATALAEKVSALMTEDYLEQRGRRANREKFESALSKVPNVEPDERDRL
ncbi:MAG: toxin-antitoxin system HicB family antitoxin [Proteobacteria bacterium]|nr:toxin-antitoxin system HicB family antitoxin [Pseudomonadota bacterium]